MKNTKEEALEIISKYIDDTISKQYFTKEEVLAYCSATILNITVNFLRENENDTADKHPAIKYMRDNMPNYDKELSYGYICNKLGLIK